MQPLSRSNPPMEILWRTLFHLPSPITLIWDAFVFGDFLVGRFDWVVKRSVSSLTKESHKSDKSELKWPQNKVELDDVYQTLQNRPHV